MKNKLQVAGLAIITALVILAAAHSNDTVQEKCSKEWLGVSGLHSGLRPIGSLITR